MSVNTLPVIGIVWNLANMTTKVTSRLLYIMFEDLSASDSNFRRIRSMVRIDQENYTVVVRISMAPY